MRKRQFAIGMIAAFICVAMMGAVNGIFANVTASGFINSVTGYEFAGAAPANHLLVGNGSQYVDATTLPNASLPNVGTPGTTLLPTSITTDAQGRVTATVAGPAFTGTSGFQTLGDGLILEWGTTGDFDTGPQTVTFPLTFPNGCLWAQTGQYQDSGTQAQETLIVPTGGVICTTTQLTLRNNGVTNQTWFAIGH